MLDRLSSLQHEVLGALQFTALPWVLTGGAALAGFHLGHRATRDLDLFWKGEESLGDRVRLVTDALRARGFGVETVQPGVAFYRLRVAKGDDFVLLDLVADPVPEIEPAVEVELAGLRLRVDTAHEILVNKLCTLLQRSEVRDLIDVRALVNTGGDLSLALSDAPQKDAGFSALLLAWQLEGLPVEPLAKAEGLEATTIRELLEFQSSLVSLLRKGTHPESDS